jgi:hypothetical protein
MDQWEICIFENKVRLRNNNSGLANQTSLKKESFANKEKQ